MNSKKSYAEQLKDPRWQKKRLEILQRDNFSCRRCLDNTSTLHVHHKTYVVGKLAWDYDNHNFLTLCEACHDIEEAIISKKKELVERMKKEGVDVINHCLACGNTDVLCYSPYIFTCNICGFRYNMKNKEHMEQLV